MLISMPLVHCILRCANGKDLAKYAKARVHHSFAERSVCAIMAEKIVESHIFSMMLRECRKLCVEG